ncbi:MAG: ceramidase [Pirellula sp.]|nr:ceramidase [Pirellula sp.]
MSDSFFVCQFMLQLYRERGEAPNFWGEPLNAISNASFLFAAAFGLDLAVKRRDLKPTTLVLILLAATIGCGSFLFHTMPTVATMWLDVIPITLFQVVFLWFISRTLLPANVRQAVAIVALVVGTSFVLMPIKSLLNGSLFYFPSLVAMWIYSLIWARKSEVERGLLGFAALFFSLAIIARSIDWEVPWSFGTHFIWHLLNGAVVYSALRTWILASPLR